MRNFTRNISLAFVPVLVFLFLWQFLVEGNRKMEFLLSTPSNIGAVISEDILKISYWENIAATSAAMIGGFVVAVVIGALIGFFLWWFRPIRQIGNIYLLALGSIPVFALAPLIIFWFGVGYIAKIVVVMFSAVFLIASGFLNSSVEAERLYGEVVMGLGGNRRVLFSKVVFPGALFFSIPTIKSAVSLAIIGAFVAEWISSEIGVGKYILTSLSLFDVPRMMFGILTFLIVATLFSTIIEGVLTLVWGERRRALKEARF